MSYKSRVSIAIVAAAFFSVVGNPATHGNALAQSSSGQKPAATVEHAAIGTVNAIDRDKGTVNISHTAVATAQWPAMTMTFKLANPAAVPADVTAGQKVSFRFTIEGGMSATVTSIKKAE